MSPSDLGWDDPALQVKSDSPRVAKYRALQSWFREAALKAPYGEYTPRGQQPRPLGSLLSKHAVRENRGLNLLGEAAPGYADQRVPMVRREGGTLEEKRLRHNMLSSMPMCFSIFGELRSWDDRGLAVVRELFDPDAESVELMECEWKPATDLLGDRTAFDAVIITKRSRGAKHLIGIETKYTEPFSAKPYTKTSYEQVHRDCGWFRSGTEAELVPGVTNQLWRNTLLAASCQMSREDGVKSAVVSVLALDSDVGAAKALSGVRSALKEPNEQCLSVTIEQLVDVVSKIDSHGEAWASTFRQRYLDLAPVIEAGLDERACG